MDGKSSPRRVYLVRHGETAWSLSGQHTGTTDLALTERGEDAAKRLAEPLSRVAFARVLTSPMQRARRTGELAGLGAQAAVDSDLMEWNYGDYEGLTTEQIRARAPGWILFRDGCPGGESPDAIGARVDRLVARVRSIDGDVALFAHGHVFRVLAARWLGLPVIIGRHLLLDTATVSVLAYDREVPAVKQWNVSLG